MSELPSAASAGVSTRTVRHYHGIGLLPEPARRANGYRRYGLRDLVPVLRVRRLVGHGVWAWVALGLHLYALAWTGGLLASLRVLPHRVGREAVELRDASSATSPSRTPRSPGCGRRRANVRRSGLRVDGAGHALYAHGDTTVLIELRPGARVLLDGEPYPHRIGTPAVTVDDPAGFVRAVADRSTARVAAVARRRPDRSSIGTAHPAAPIGTHRTAVGGSVPLMTTSPGLARKVQQLDNDVEAIYEMLTTIQVTQTRQHNRLVEIADAQVEQGTTLDQHTATLAEHTATLAEHTATLAEHTATLAEHGSKLDRIIALLESR